MLNLLTILWDQIWSFLKVLLGSSVIGVLGVKMWERQKNKKKEGLEITKLSVDGENALNLLKANIKKEVDEKTQAFKEEIDLLNNTIIKMSVKHTRDIDSHVARMAELEEKMDAHRERADKIEDRNDKIEKQKTILEQSLEEEIKLRKSCIKQLEDLQSRVTDLEKNSLQSNGSVIITNNNTPKV